MKSQCRSGCGGNGRIPGAYAELAAARAVPQQMWQRRAQSRCRCPDSGAKHAIRRAPTLDKPVRTRKQASTRGVARKLCRRDPVPLQTWPRWDDAPSLYGLGSSEQSAPQLRSNFASAPGLGSHVRRCIHRDWAHLIAVIRRNDGAHGPCIGHRHSVWCTAASGLLAGRFANRPDSTPGSRRRPKDSSKVPLDRRWKQGPDPA